MVELVSCYIAVMIAERSSAWLGPLARAGTDVGARVRDDPSMKVLLARGWRAEQTLLYIPPRREEYDLNVAVVGRAVNVGDDAPVLWVFSTIGLGAVDQARRGDAQAFRRAELVVAFDNSEPEDPFPTKIGVALAQEPEPFAGWDWSQVEVPPLLDWISIAGEELGAAIRFGSTFAIADTLTLGPGNSAWTRSRLEQSVLLPVNPQMLDAGLGPFDSSASPRRSFDPQAWRSSPGTESFTRGFYWLLPVSQSEYDKANTEGTWNMFADLVEQAQALGKGDFSRAYDLLR